MKKFALMVALAVGVATIPLFAANEPPAKVEPAKKAAEPKKLNKDEVAQYLQDISVTIRAGNAEGSGVITNVDGVNYVLTCGHVVAHLRQTREIIDPVSGARRTVVEFDDAEVVKVLVEDGRTVGSMRFFAEVLRYSDAENGEDLALLRVRKKDLVKTRVHFYQEDKIPPLGTTLFHVGSLLGQSGSNSMTVGIMSQHGRIHQGTVYDQTTCAAFPGSSGGGVYLEDGRYCAMIVRGAGETFNLVVPQRRIKTWAKRVGVEFVLTDTGKAPDETILRKQSIEEVPVRGRDKMMSGAAKKFKFLIQPLDKDGERITEK